LDLKTSDFEDASSVDRGDEEFNSRDSQMVHQLGTMFEIGKNLSGTVHSATFVKQGETILRLSTKDGDCVIETVAAAPIDPKSDSKGSHPRKREVVAAVGKNVVTLLLAFALAALIWYSLSTFIGIYTRRGIPKPVLDQGMDELHRKLAKLSLLVEANHADPNTAKVLAHLGETFQKSREFILEQRRNLMS